MTAKRRNLLIGFTSFAFLVSCYFFFLEKDPVYKGHRMSEWVASMGVNARYSSLEFNPNEKDAHEAVIALSTNNIPLLVQWLAYDPEHSVRLRAIKLIPRSMLPPAVIKQTWRAYLREQAKATGSLAAFKIIGESGSTAVPQLAHLVRTGSETQRTHALQALSSIGKAGMPTVLSAATNVGDSSEVRLVAIARLSLFTNEPTVQTFLLAASHDTNEMVAAAAANALKGNNLYRY